MAAMKPFWAERRCGFWLCWQQPLRYFILWINLWSADSVDTECKYFVDSTELNIAEELNILKRQHTREEKIWKHKRRSVPSVPIVPSPKT